MIMIMININIMIMIMIMIILFSWREARATATKQKQLLGQNVADQPAAESIGDRTEDGGGMPRQRGQASPEGLRSEKMLFFIVKHCENEKSATKTTKTLGKIDFSDFRFSFSLCCHSQHVRDLTL